MGSAALAITAGIENRWLRGLAVLALMASPVIMLLGFPLMVAAIWVLVR
ncbi:hypothetical protein [Aureimonas pseudogalii]|uniref:Uncharacterized protein n=1 Tax=Aureimonas pseudogalii TaxID=1744844 RepID=A0A7W6EBN6_9HYPH|nr:hypothetical protein [Aureimonas pseudogalii]MBB3998393.1 hypothetical protein [Aureimonas pseudogalii]